VELPSNQHIDAYGKVRINIEHLLTIKTSTGLGIIIETNDGDPDFSTFE
jgi:hypothetical protein